MKIQWLYMPTCTLARTLLPLILYEVMMLTNEWSTNFLEVMQFAVKFRRNRTLHHVFAYASHCTASVKLQIHISSTAEKFKVSSVAHLLMTFKNSPDKRVRGVEIERPTGRNWSVCQAVYYGKSRFKRADIAGTTTTGPQGLCTCSRQQATRRWLVKWESEKGREHLYVILKTYKTRI